jgi:hypothetical protein
MVRILVTDAGTSSWFKTLSVASSQRTRYEGEHGPYCQKPTDTDNLNSLRLRFNIGGWQNPFSGQGAQQVAMRRLSMIVSGPWAKFEAQRARVLGIRGEYQQNPTDNRRLTLTTIPALTTS